MDKPTAAKAPFFALSDHALLALEGRDAIAFAQAQCMSDIATLADGQWQWSGWLSPKGRVQALFALLRVGPETIWLLLPDGDAVALKAAMERFVFRTKVKLRVPEDASVCGSFTAPTEASGATTSTDAKGQVEFDFGDGARPRTLRICSGCTAPTDADALDRWRAYDIKHGLPRPGTATLDAFTRSSCRSTACTPTACARAATRARKSWPAPTSSARPSAAWRSSAAASPRAGAQVMEADRAIGTVVAAGHLGGRVHDHPVLALAVLPLERADDAPGLQVDGATLGPLPLLDGLAR